MRTIKHNLGNKDGVFAVSYKDKTGAKKSADFTGIALNAPADTEALEQWHNGKTFSFGDASTGDGAVEFKGLEAAAAAKVMHDIETVRGKAREKLAGGASHQAVQEWLRKEMLNYRPGKSLTEAAKPVEVDIGKLMAAQAQGPEALAAYLASVGATVTQPTEPQESDVERQARELAEAVDRRLEEQDDESDDQQ